MATQLQCPSCGSEHVIRLARNDISPFRGYRCQNCLRRLRDHGSFVIYAIVLLVGLFFTIGFLVEMDFAKLTLWKLCVGGISFICLIYSGRELLRATPRRIHPTKSNMPQGWYYARHETRIGPYSWEELCLLFESHVLTSSDMLLDPRSGNWISANEIQKIIPSLISSEIPLLPIKPPIPVTPQTILVPRVIRRPKLFYTIVLTVSLTSIMGPIFAIWRTFQPPVKQQSQPKYPQ